MSEQHKTNTSDFDRLRDYILACPTISKESSAIAAALKGLDLELKRIERDAKLKRKFSLNNNSNSSNNNNVTATSSTTTTTARGGNGVDHQQRRNHQQQQQQGNSAIDEDMMMISSSKNKGEEFDVDDEDDWQDVNDTNKHGEEDECSALGNRLAQLTVKDLAHHGTKVDKPLSAIALALHAALVCTDVGYVCTGIPEDPKKKVKGFAAPIRPLPKNQFLPSKWDTNSNDKVALRYRRRNKEEDSVVLRVSYTTTNNEEDGMMMIDNINTSSSKIQVSIVPLKAEEEEPKIIFNMEDHLNLESFQAALKKGGSGVAPSLHYKALATLLTNVCRHLDIGSLAMQSEESNSIHSNEAIKHHASLPYTDATVVQPPISSDPLRIPTSRNKYYPEGRNAYNPYQIPTIRGTFHDPSRRGDFAGDLGPDFSMGIGGGGGNLMGPNHPMFNGGPGGPNIIGGPSIGGGGFGMRPRFDPVGPPGGPQDPYNNFDPNNPNNNANNNRRRRPPPGGMGEPNPDHARPPNNLNNNMFM